jgi:hypothetical protein
VRLTAVSAFWSCSPSGLEILVIVGPPAAPLASAMTVSLVLVSPSTCEDQHFPSSQASSDLPGATVYVILQPRLALLSLCGCRPYTNYASSCFPNYSHHWSEVRTDPYSPFWKVSGTGTRFLAMKIPIQGTC